MDYFISAHLHYSLIDMTYAKSSSHICYTLVWIGLLLLTLVTYYLGEVNQTASSFVYVLLAITMIKSQLVANYFMGLRHVALKWRIIMLVYFLIVGGLIALAYS